MTLTIKTLLSNNGARRAVRAFSMCGVTAEDRKTRKQMAMSVCKMVASVGRRNIAGDESATWLASVGTDAYDSLSVSMRTYRRWMPRCGHWIISSHLGHKSPRLEYHMTIWEMDRENNLRIAEAWGGVAGAQLRDAQLSGREGHEIVISGSPNAWAARQHRSSTISEPKRTDQP